MNILKKKYTKNASTEQKFITYAFKEQKKFSIVYLSPATWYVPSNVKQLQKFRSSILGLLGPDCVKLHIFKTPIKHAPLDTSQYLIGHRSKFSNIAEVWLTIKKCFYMLWHLVTGCAEQICGHEWYTNKRKVRSGEEMLRFQRNFNTLDQVIWAV